MVPTQVVAPQMTRIEVVVVVVVEVVLVVVVVAAASYFVVKWLLALVWMLKVWSSGIAAFQLEQCLERQKSKSCTMTANRESDRALERTEAHHSLLRH